MHLAVPKPLTFAPLAETLSIQADMIINGILPLEQMRDYILPCAMITRRIPRATFNSLYGLDLKWRSENGQALTWVDLAFQTLTEHAMKRVSNTRMQRHELTW